VKPSTHHHLVSKLRMSGAITLLPLLAAVAWTGTPLHLPFFSVALEPIPGLGRLIVKDSVSDTDTPSRPSLYQ
jgi:hypothetical protein